MAIENKIYLNERDFERLILITKNWQNDIVKKIRDLRVIIKKFHFEGIDEVYLELKKMELSSEFIEHIIIEKLFLEVNKFHKSSLLVKDLYILNLKNYFKSLNLRDRLEEDFIQIIFKSIKLRKQNY